MFKFNDDYQARTIEAFGTSWETIGQDKTVLTDRRKQLGMTQQQVADAAHIQLRQYQRLESGERTMASASMRIGLSICYVLKLDPFRFWPSP